MVKAISEPRVVRVLFPKAPIMNAVTVAHTSGKSGTDLLHVTLNNPDQAELLHDRILESTIQAHMLLNAGKFKTFRGSHDNIVASEEVALDFDTNNMPLFKTDKIHKIETAYRSNEFPRAFQQTKWVEPFVYGEGDSIMLNAGYKTARFEMVLFVDPSKIFYDYTPVELIKKGDQYEFYVSGAIIVVEGAVEAVVHKRTKKAISALTESA